MCIRGFCENVSVCNNVFAYVYIVRVCVRVCDTVFADVFVYMHIVTMFVREYAFGNSVHVRVYCAVARMCERV